MKEFETITMKEEKQLVKSITCNCCGKTTELDGEDYQREWKLNEFQHLNLIFGYGSKFDMDSWTFDLCEDCLLEYVKTFKLVPNGFMLDRYNDLTQEQHQMIFDNWKETGDWDEFKFKTYEELIELAQIYDTEYINEVIKKFHPDKPLLEINDGIE